MLYKVLFAKVYPMYLGEKMQTMKWKNMKDIDKMIETKK